jgi:hypothetical protein
MTTSARFRRLSAPFFAAAGVIATVGVATYVRPQQAEASNAETSSAVTTAAIEALVVHQQAYAFAPPAMIPAADLRQPTTAAAIQNGPAPTAARVNKVAAVGRTFTGTAADQEVGLVDAVQRANASSDFKSLDGGVSSVAIDSVKINGRHAQIHGLATMWSSVAQQRPDGRWVVATPRNTLQVTLELDPDVNGRWKVSAFKWTFAPGSEP